MSLVLGLRSRAVTITLATVVAGGLILACDTALSPAAAASVHPSTVASTCSQAYLPLPDPGCQPGANNPNVTASTIHSTICVSGYSSSIRPPTSYTSPLKIRQIGEYGYSDTSTADYEEDHLIALEDGGDHAARRTSGPKSVQTFCRANSGN